MVQLSTSKATQCISHRRQGVSSILGNPYQGDTCKYVLNVFRWIGNKDVPCYTCLEQSAPAIPACQTSTLDHLRIAHRLYSIITATYKHPEAIMHSKQKL